MSACLRQHMHKTTKAVSPHLSACLLTYEFSILLLPSQAVVPQTEGAQ